MQITCAWETQLLSLYDQKETPHGNGGPYDCLPCKVLKMFVVILHL